MMNTFNLSSSLNLLQGLGKPTRRGIKKCTKCGIYNGTRRSFCKNKHCGVSLKSQTASSFEFDAVKLITGTVRQVYSVQVKDTLSECRGFVQLPLLPFSADTSGNILSDVALCFVDSCQSSFDQSILMCHEEVEPNGRNDIMCNHIDLALKSQAVAKPIGLNKSILNRLKIPNEMKKKLQILTADNVSPLVQRVSKDTMAVKCQVAPKQPLGYLHFKFLKRKNEYDGYSCSCTESLVAGLPEMLRRVKYKCIHYYACVAALASHQTYVEEFSHFIGNELNGKEKSTLSTISSKIIKEADTINVKKLKNSIPSSPFSKKSNTSIRKELLRSPIPQKKYTIKKCKNIVPKIYPIEIKVLNETNASKTTDNDVNWSFLDWISFVTESINRTMQFINCGIINTQVFYIPETFFKSFKSRIPDVYHEQKTGMGSVFYSIMNVSHVKDIFDTPKVKLRIAKKFIHDPSSGYIEYDENSENSAAYHSSFIFFLNVGQSTVDESDNCNNAFIIEWLPDIYSTTKIGQLKFQYKYGRKSI